MNDETGFFYLNAANSWLGLRSMTWQLPPMAITLTPRNVRL